MVDNIDKFKSKIQYWHFCEKRIENTDNNT